MKNWAKDKIKQIIGRYIVPIDEILDRAIKPEKAHKQKSKHKHHDSLAKCLSRYNQLDCDQKDLHKALSESEPELTEDAWDRYIDGWHESFDKWKKEEYLKMKKFIALKPTDNNIHLLLKLYFEEEVRFTEQEGALSFLFTLPNHSWEDQYFTSLGAIPFSTVWDRSYKYIFPLLDNTTGFNDTKKLCCTLEFWENQIASMIKSDNADDSSDWLRRMIEPQPKVFLRIIKKLIHEIRNNKKPTAWEEYKADRQKIIETAESQISCPKTLCPKCAAPLSTERALMCLSCGFQWFQCPNCNAEWERGSRTCQSCHKKIDEMT